MGVVKDMSSRYEKYSAKMAPDRVGARYGAAKPIATSRFLEGTARVRPIVDIVKNVLDTLGVPAGQYAIYISFAQYIAKRANSYGSKTLDNRILGAKANWVARGADPAVLDAVVNVLRGFVPTGK